MRRDFSTLFSSEEGNGPPTLIGVQPTRVVTIGGSMAGLNFTKVTKQFSTADKTSAFLNASILA